MKIPKLTKYQKIFFFSVLVVAAIALFDIWSMNSRLFGTPESYVVGNFCSCWWDLFFRFNLVLIILISFSYYFFGKKDKSEAISLGISSLILWLYGGIADILFFWLQAKPIPSNLPWLDGNLILGNISKFLGFEGVTNISIVLISIIGLIFVYHLNKYLVEKL